MKEEYTTHKRKINHPYKEIHQHKDTNNHKHKQTEQYQVLLEEPTMENAKAFPTKTYIRTCYKTYRNGAEKINLGEKHRFMKPTILELLTENLDQ